MGGPGREHHPSKVWIAINPKTRIQTDLILNHKPHTVSAHHREEKIIIIIMEDLKKRKMEEIINGQDSSSSSSSQEQLRNFLEPLSKSQLVDLLSKLYVSSHPSLHSFRSFNPIILLLW